MSTNNDYNFDSNFEFQNEIGNEMDSKLEYIGNVIFDFTTYDSDMDELFAKNMLTVLKHILNKTTYDYITNESNYLNYITMVNMPFLCDKIDWGTSIRGAFLTDDNDEYEIDCGRIIIEKYKLKEFIEKLILWSEF